MSSASKPIRIGYCLSLTGPLPGNSRSAQLAHQLWRENVNNRGGLLGRPVDQICYDDQADASQVAGLYKRLMDDGKVALIIGGYGGARHQQIVELLVNAGANVNLADSNRVTSLQHARSANYHDIEKILVTASGRY